MRCSFVFLLFLMCSATSFAQSVNKRLHNYIAKEGSVYFIRDYFIKGKRQNVDKFEVDMTYLTGRDSVTVNFSVISRNPSSVTTLTLSNGTMSVSASSVELLYHEPAKTKYLVRTTAKVAYHDIQQLYSSDAPLTFCMQRKDGQQGMVTYKPSQWKKEKTLFGSIFYIIDNQ